MALQDSQARRQPASRSGRVPGPTLRPDHSRTTEAGLCRTQLHPPCRLRSDNDQLSVVCGRAQIIQFGVCSSPAKHIWVVRSLHSHGSRKGWACKAVAFQGICGKSTPTAQAAYSRCSGLTASSAGFQRWPPFWLLRPRRCISSIATVARVLEWYRRALQSDSEQHSRSRSSRTMASSAPRE